MTVVSATSDNAARATIRDLWELKHKEPKSLRELPDEHWMSKSPFSPFAAVRRSHHRWSCGLIIKQFSPNHFLDNPARLPRRGADICDFLYSLRTAPITCRSHPIHLSPRCGASCAAPPLHGDGHQTNEQWDVIAPVNSVYDVYDTTEEPYMSQ